MRFDSIGLFWEDQPTSRKRGERVLGPMPPWTETGWTPPKEFPTIIDAPWISLDCETYDPELTEYGPGWARGKGHIVGVSICTPKGAWYFPIRHEVQKELNMDADVVLAWLRYSLSGNQPKIGANLIYDIGWLNHEGVEVNGPYYDVQYAEPLLDEMARVNLEGLGWKYLREGKLTDELKDWAQNYYGTNDKTWRKDIWRCPVSLVGPYAEQDAILPYKVLMRQWPQLVARGLLDLFELESRNMKLLIKMRFAGITLDLPYVERLKEQYVGFRDEAQQRVNEMVGFDVNTNAGDSLAQAFDKLGIRYGYTAPSQSFPEGRPSFTADFLKTVSHEFAKQILQVKGYEKLIGTFIQSYLLDSNVNGKLFCSFHPLMGEGGGARTGRFASSDPNLQNIPTRTNEGRLIRQAFIPDYGHRCIRAIDYSQIEYRMLAHYATGPGSDEVRARYWADPNLDYHKLTGTIVQEQSGLELKRAYIKNVNFGIIYGVGIDHLAEMLGVDVKTARDIIKTYHTSIPFAKATMNATMEEVGQTGLCTTILNRQTHFDLWEPDDWGRDTIPLPYREAVARWGSKIRRAYLYKALNYRLQGSAADVMKVAMDKCHTSGVFDEIGVPRLTVHDELVFSDHGEARQEAWDEMQHLMDTAIECRVPIRAEMEEGANWAECKS